MDRILVFDLWGDYAHYKKIYATTTALTYPIPVKTALYGLFGSIMGMDNRENAYLNYFQSGQCKVGIQILRPLVFQRININLRSVFGAMKPRDNRKPTTMEFVRRPRYRIYVAHADAQLMNDLVQLLKDRQSIFTPSLGLANLLANFEFVADVTEAAATADTFLPIHSVIPRRSLINLDNTQAFNHENYLVEVSQYSLEMDTDRNVLDRDDILLDRQGQPISARVTSSYSLEIANKRYNVILF